MSGNKKAMDRIYLDHNATTPVIEEVVNEMLPLLSTDFGNSSSIHAEGRKARAALDSARGRTASLIGADPDEIVFTSGGTESNNLALRGTAELREPGHGRLVTSAVEHQAVQRPMLNLQQNRGHELTLLGVGPTGLVDPEELRETLSRGDVFLVSVIWANNETGTLQPVRELGGLCREAGALFHVDAVQAAGKVEIDVHSLPVDLLSISAHKFYGPKGAGALYVRRGLELAPLFTGGTHERGRRAGTVNTPALAGMGKAAELAAEGIAERMAGVAGLRDMLWEGISSRTGGVRLNGDPEKRVANTLNVSFEGVEGEPLLMNLDLRGISCSSGSACSSGSFEPSHVITAMGVAPELAQASLRFSLGRGNTAEQIGRVVDETVAVVEKLRSMEFSF